MKIVNIHFYKAAGEIEDKMIRWWTKSIYSHVELEIDGIWYSTSPRDLKVRAKEINLNVQHWDTRSYVVSQSQIDAILEFYEETKGSPYDWKGILLSQFIKLGIHSIYKWFCSEWVANAMSRAEMIIIDYPHKFSPGDLIKFIDKAVSR